MDEVHRAEVREDGVGVLGVAEEGVHLVPRPLDVVRGLDERTPEGMYLLDYKKHPSAYYKAIRISYPNRSDVERARRAGVHPGSAIMIHGQPDNAPWPPEIAQRFNWTNGCIAVTNAEMDEIWDAVEVGTLIEIRP